MQVLNLQSLKSRVDRTVPWVYIRSNFVLFNKSAVELIGLQVGDRVEFHEDGVLGFYVVKTNDVMGFPIIKTANSVGISNKSLVRHICDRYKLKAAESVYFSIKESTLPAEPYVKWQLNLKVQKNG